MKLALRTFLGLLPSVCLLHAQATQIPDSERTALIDLYQSTDGDNWRTHTNWLDPETAADTWYGVRVEAGHVTALDLSNNDLTGTIAPELENLENLRELRLGGNQLTGGIPRELGDLLNLQVLSLEVNQLTGSLPPELGQLENLEELYLYANALDDTLPKELGNLTKLRVFHAYRNGFTGEIPKEFGNLANLEVLVLSLNQLEGTIPTELGDLALLRDLYLNQNTLIGPIPASFGNLTALRTLDLSRNALTGAIPANLGSLADLEFLTLDDNALVGPLPAPTADQFPKLKNFTASANRIDGSIPAALGSIETLETLSLARNLLEGTLPSGLGSLSQLYFLDLSSNDLRGGVPSAWSGMTNLRDFRLADNRLNFELPHAVEAMTRLQYIDFSRNYFRGSIPQAWTTLAELRRLDLSDNRLNGTLPTTLGNLQMLEFLGLSGNALDGPIPDSMGQLEHLRQFSLGGNRLTGSLPSTIGGLSSLETLSLNDNQLSGELPAALTELSNLQRLALGGNTLSGNLPANLGQLAKLRMLDLGRNRFSGPIPATITRLTELGYLDLSRNRCDDGCGSGFTGAVPASLWQIPRLRYADLSKNLLTGTLLNPPAGTTLLGYLDVSDNQLTGPIPGALLSLSGLETLRLDHNHFQGELGEGLAKFVAGSTLDLTGNAFEGAVPRDLLEKPGLRTLILDGNRFSSFSPQFTGPSDLEVLSLADNGITLGANDPTFNHFPQLRVLNLEGNTLSAVPDLSELTDLEVLSLDGNGIDQEFPAQLTGLTKLRVLSIRGNHFRGAIPGAIRDLIDLGDGASDFRGNLLHVEDPAVEAFLEGKQAGGSWNLEYLFPYYSENTSSVWRFTSFAFSNPSADEASNVQLDYIDVGGQTAGQARIGLEPRRQKALLGREFWLCADPESGCSATAPPNLQFEGWVRASFDSPAVRGFFLFTRGEGMMDGGLPATRPAQHLVFTRTSTDLNGRPVSVTFQLVNPYSTPAKLQLQLHDASGSVVSETSRNLSALSALRGSTSDLFGSATLEGDYLTIDVTEGGGIAGFEILSANPPGTLMGLSPWTELTADRLYSAQVAYIPQTLETNLHLVNLGSETAALTLTGILTTLDGKQTETDVEPLSLEPGAGWTGNLAELFGLPGGRIGALRVESSVPGIVGDVLFLETNLDYAAAMQLDAEPSTAAVFSQVANVGSFFTGLALFNPGDEPAEVILSVFTAAGEPTGQATLTLEARTRTSANLSELVPESAGQVGGYIKLTSDRPIVAEEIFVQSNQIYVAVPPSK